MLPHCMLHLLIIPIPLSNNSSLLYALQVQAQTFQTFQTQRTVYLDILFHLTLVLICNL